MAAATTAGRFPLPPGEGQGRESTAGKAFMLSVASAGIALPVNCLRYVSHGAGSAQGAASRRRPLYPRAPASKIATAWCLRLIPAGFGSGRGSVRAKHGPQPASMRAAPAFRERLSDFEAVSTGSLSNHGEYINDRSHEPCRPGKAQPPPGKNTAQARPNRVAGIRRHASLSGILPAGAMISRFRVNLQVSQE